MAEKRKNKNGSEGTGQRPDRYAGDEAWREWFDLCSVSRCGDDARQKLTEQVRSAMFAQLGRFGFGPESVEGDDAVAFFDSYFRMKGSRETDKPLKSYFRERIDREGMSMRNFVCGTLFGASAGRVHDIVRDWIASVKGWKAHSLTAKDGTRHLVWESAAEGGDAREKMEEMTATEDFRPCSDLDRAALRVCAREMVESVAAKLKTENRIVAILLYAAALNVPVSSRTVLARMGLAKSRSSVIRKKCMEESKKFFEERQADASDILLPRVLIAVCGEMMSAEDRKVFIGKETL